MNRTTKNFLTVLLVFVLLVFAVPCPAFAEDGHTAENHSHEGWTAWGDNENEKNTLPTEAGRYYLTSDIELSKTHVFSNTAGMELCLNGNVIRLTAESGAVIELQNNCNLYLYDCCTNERYFKCVNGGVWEDAGTEKPNGTVIAIEDYDRNTANGTYVQTTGGCITGGKAGGIVMHDDYTCELYIYGGNIVGNTNPESGGGIDVKNGRVYLYGGSIAGNTAGKYGGGISLRQASYYIWLPPALLLKAEGGCITGNTSGKYGGGVYGNEISDISLTGTVMVNGNKAGSYGGGVYTAGNLSVEGGTVKGNSAATWGGGLYASTKGNITMSGGLVTWNSAPNGGGVYDNNIMTMSGGTITGNAASSAGGGIRMGNIDSNSSSARKLTITGGTINENSSANGGGIYVGIGGVLNISDVDLSANKASKYGGGIDIDTDGVVNITGGTITGNNAGTYGGGICWAGENTTLGGTVNITGNTQGNNVNNVLITKDHAITLGEGDSALKDGAKIGISLQAPDEGLNCVRKFTVNGSLSDESFFQSDDTSRNYGPYYNENGYLDIVFLHLHYDTNGNRLNFKEWADPSSLPKDGGAWYLTTDVKLKRDWEPTADTKLCLNGHMISSENGSCLWLEEVSLDLYDEADSAVHYFRYNKGSEWSYLGDSVSENAVYLNDTALDVMNDGTIIAVPGGVITGWDMFVSVYSDLATDPQVHFNMFGGNIVGIQSDYAEPVCIIGDTTFTMYGGSVVGNFFPYGDIIRNYNGSVNLLGGTIAGNIASGAVVYSTHITIAGTTAIHNNFSEKGAVYVGENDIVLGGSAQIRQNVTASAGTPINVYLGSKYKVVLSSPEQGMSVGITAETVPEANSPVLISTAAAEGDEAYFFSDGEYDVKFKPSDSSEDALYLTVNGVVASIFGGSSIGLIAVLAGVLALGIAFVVISSRKAKADVVKAEYMKSSHPNI